MLLSFKSLTNARGGTRESALSRFSSCFAAACSLLLTRIAPRFRALTILPHIRISCSLRYTFISLWGNGALANPRCRASHPASQDIRSFIPREKQMSASQPLVRSCLHGLLRASALSQSFPIFAYRVAYATLLCSYRGMFQGHMPTFVQAQVGTDLLTL